MAHTQQGFSGKTDPGVVVRVDVAIRSFVKEKESSSSVGERVSDWYSTDNLASPKIFQKYSPGKDFNLVSI